MVPVAWGLDSGGSFIVGALGWIHHFDWNRKPRRNHDDLALPTPHGG